MLDVHVCCVCVQFVVTKYDDVMKVGTSTILLKDVVK